VAVAALRSLASGPLPGLILSLLLLAALLLLSIAAQNEAELANLYAPLLAINLIGILVLLALCMASLFKLLRQVRARIIGSRLTLRMVMMFVTLAFLPLLVVYYISIQFLSRGIDSWFDVRIEQAMGDAVLLGQVSLKSLKDSQVEILARYIPELAMQQSNIDIIDLLDHMREHEAYSETTLFSQDGRILASSSPVSGSLVPSQPPERVFSALRSEGVYAEQERAGDGGNIFRMVIAVPSRAVGISSRYLQAIKPIPLRFANLEESINNAIAEYERLVYLRGPLKFGFILTLSLVSLMTLLLAVWIATYMARRLAAPLKELAEGTQAVANGNYATRLVATSSDELGILIGSFNRMTEQIALARENALQSQRELEDQHAYLETVLEHLSSGVLSFDARGRLRTCNSSAAQILGISDQRLCMQLGIDILGKRHDHLSDFFATLAAVMQRGDREWQQEIVLFTPRGRQILLCRGSRLPGGEPAPAGHVFVFDDVTTLIQAQRDAAWGEVARRLAHEIKNPLTPIKLSAERIRQKYLNQLGDTDTRTLDRATRTISEQVESMKEMVNAFSNYAQPVRMNLDRVDLNQLITDVVELHKDHTGSLSFTLSLDPFLPGMILDAGRMRQVLNNLIGNAVHALQETADGHIEIISELESGDGSELVSVCITDNGPGIREDLMERLFEPYVTSKEKGGGLGLAIVKKIVEEHGGKIWAENLPEQGARLCIQLPVRHEAGQQADDLASATRQGS